MILIRVRMVRCLGEEPRPPDDPEQLDVWCAQGRSARPIQLHLGDHGDVLWINPFSSLCVRFDDGDERLVFRGEVELLTRG